MKVLKRFSSNLLPLLIHVIMPIAFGGAIYLLFRAKSMLVFRCIRGLGMETTLDTIRSRFTIISTGEFPWLFYSLPDAMWVYSLTAYMVLIWRGKLTRGGFVWISIGPLLALGAELGQALGLVGGTYDIADVVLCLIGTILPLLLLSPKNQRQFRNWGEVT